MSYLDPPAPTPVPPGDVPATPGPNAPAEPLLTVGTITAVVTALLTLVVALGMPVSDDTQAAILAVVAVLAPFVVAAIGRGRVFSPASVRRMVLRAKGQRP